MASQAASLEALRKLRDQINARQASLEADQAEGERLDQRLRGPMPQSEYNPRGAFMGPVRASYNNLPEGVTPPMHPGNIYMQWIDRQKERELWEQEGSMGDFGDYGGYTI